MDIPTVTAFQSLAAGAVGFFAPCVLPVLPAFAAAVAAVGLSRDPSGGGPFRASVLAGLGFLVGFGTVFVVSGATATSLAWRVRAATPFLERLGGVALLLIGAFLAWRMATGRGIVRPQADRRGLLGLSALAGVGLGAAWTPCIGPVLASVLLEASFPDTLARGTAMLGVYVAGLALPFLVLALGVAALLHAAASTARLETVTRATAAGAAFVVGALLLSGRVSTLTASLARFGTLLDFGL
jgi:cytochrome c-type biogenesis protein